MAGAERHTGVTAGALDGGAIAELQSSLAAGEQTAVQALARSTTAVDAQNEHLNAIVTRCPERAAEAARATDARLETGEQHPLDGIPFTVKDVIAVAGLRMTAGSRLCADHVPIETAPAIRRLEEAGAVLVGKTNCPEFGLDTHTDNDLFGATLNPLDETRTPGGSSGGDSAAVAAGLVPFSIGSDYGGSLRWPAQCTGTVGFRPTTGLVSSAGKFPFVREGRIAPPNSASFGARVQTMGPIAGSVADAWQVLALLAGPGGADARVAPVVLGDAAAVDVEALPVAWADGDGAVELHAGAAAAVERAAAALERAGLRVARERPSALAECEDVYAAYRAADGLALQRELARGREELLTETMRTWFERVDDASVGELQHIAAQSDRLRAEVLAFMEDWPIMLLPVANGPAFELGAADFDQRFGLLTPSRAISLLGLPTCAVPVTGKGSGQVLSVQVIGRPFRDHEVAAVAHRLQRTLDG